MEKLFYTASIFNWLAAMYLIFMGLKLMARPHSQMGNVITMLLAGLIFLALAIVSFMFWNSNYRLASVWLSWLPWIVIVISFSIFMVLTAGVKWN